MKLAINVFDNEAKSTKEMVNISELTFGREFNEALVHQVVVSYLAGARQGTKAQKTRAQVSGGGIKPWKQKGTGRARAGSIRSPLWRKGGKIFAATPRDHSVKVNKKMYRGAMQCILSELIRQDRLILVEEFKIHEPRTKLLLEKLNILNLNSLSVLIISHEVDENLYLSSRNLEKVSVIDIEMANPVDLIGFDKIIVTIPALKGFEEMFS